MSAPEEWDDIHALEARERRADRRERAVAIFVLVLLIVGAGVALMFGGQVA